MPGPYTYLPASTPETLKNIELVARTLVEGGMLGLHRSPFRGFSSEFAEYRKYSPGDSVRYIDWKTYARSDRYYIKCFEEETNLNAFLLLDTSASMGMKDAKNAPVKFNYACYLAGAFLYLMHQQRDASGLMTWSDTVGECSDCSNTAAHLMSCLKKLETLAPGGESNAGPCLEILAGRIPRRSLVLIFSDFLDRDTSFLKALNHLIFNRCEIVLFQILNEDERSFPYRGLVRFEDLETKNAMELDAEGVRNHYFRAFREYHSALADFCDAHRIALEPMSTAIPFERALAAYFTKREALLR